MFFLETSITKILLYHELDELHNKSFLENKQGRSRTLICVVS